jgi:Mg2+/citrate symporter
MASPGDALIRRLALDAMAVEVLALRWCSTRSIFCFVPWSGTTRRAAVSLVDGPRRRAKHRFPANG